MAEAGHVAPEHLVRLFRRQTGTTPYRYLWDERIRLAVQLLEHTGEPISGIARRCGFRTSYHFARLVRVTTGLSPTPVRQRGWDAS
jgi:AraC family transcriptional regulator of arabinose operon